MPGYVKKLSAMAKTQQQAEIDKKIVASLQQIATANEFYITAAMTNAVGWSVKTYEIANVDIDLKIKEVEIKLTYSAQGEQDIRKSAFGNRIAGDAKAIFDDDGKVTYQNVTADLVAG